MQVRPRREDIPQEVRWRLRLIGERLTEYFRKGCGYVVEGPRLIP